ncbi:MAG TPA: hypothetical protein VFS00_08105, partial [Polyangiaceae bacterium]|nr:hypothetical protein [Polyangiaceae bacterium]
MKAPSLRSIFTSLLVGHFGAVALGGCSQTPPLEPAPKKQEADDEPLPPLQISTAGFEPFSCAPLFEGAAAALGIDSIESWTFPNSGSGDRPAVGLDLKKGESDGVPCAGALDEGACLTDLARARAEPGRDGFFHAAPPSLGYKERFIVTDGGEVRTVDTLGELVALLGPLDAPEKLRFVVRYGDRDIPCQYIKRTDVGFELVGSISEACSR